MHRFFAPGNWKTDSLVELSADESQHASKVLRLKLHDELKLINGEGRIGSGVIENSNNKNLIIRVLNFTDLSPFFPSIHLCIAPTKNMNRMEWMLEKAIEIGVAEVSFFFSANSIRKELKLDRLQRIALAANKQSLRTHFAKLNPIVDFSSLLLKLQMESSEKLIAYCGEIEKGTLKQIKFNSSDYTVMIGPEGDFTTNEIELSIKSDFKVITLGKSRMRTETAGIVAISQLMLLADAI